MRYFHAYRFVFESPRWLTNWLVGAVCLLVPVVGQMVFLGYLFDIIEALHRGRPERDYPDFDFNRLLQNLVRGAWVFLVQLIVHFPLQIVGTAGFLYFYLPFWFALIRYKPGGPSPFAEVQWGLLAAFVVVYFLAILLSSLLLIPMSLRAGLSQDFGSAFSWSFIRDFVGRTWPETILATLFLMLTGAVLVLVGYLACFVGLYPALALILFAQCHLWYQLYERYLERGGEPVRLKEEPGRPGPPDERIVAADEA
jgi:hypothetical protein